VKNFGLSRILSRTLGIINWFSLFALRKFVCGAVSAIRFLGLLPFPDNFVNDVCCALFGATFFLFMFVS